MRSNGKNILFGPLPPPYGGVSVFMAALSEDAITNDFDVWYTNGKTEGTSEAKRSVDHRRLGHIWALLEAGRGTRITDSTHFHLEYPHAVLLPLWIAAKRVVPFRWVKVLHDGSLPRRAAAFGRFRRSLLKLALRNMDETVVSSQELFHWLKNDLQYKGPVIIIPTLVEVPDPENLPPLTGSDENVLSAEHVISSVGVFIASYGFHDLAAAVEKVRIELGSNIRLILIDGQFADDPAYRRQVLEGRDWIDVLGSVPHERLPQIFTSSDVFVRPCRDESLGLSRIEAILCNVPVIATNIGETRGMLTYEYGDTEALASHLRSVLTGDRPSLDHWRSEYLREAKQNRKRYIDVITGADGLTE